MFVRKQYYDNQTGALVRSSMMQGHVRLAGGVGFVGQRAEHPGGGAGAVGGYRLPGWVSPHPPR